MKARIGRSNLASSLVVLVAVLLCAACSPSNEERHLEEFRRGLDSIDRAFETADYGKAITYFGILKSIPLTKIPVNDEARYWTALYTTGFETEDFDVAIQAGVAGMGLDWDDQDIRATQPYIPMGHAVKKAGDTVKAIEWYQLALSNVSETVRADVTSNLAALYLATGQYRLALAYTDVSTRLNHFRGVTDEVAVAWTHVLKARSYGGLQMHDKARTQIDSALEIFEHQKRDGEPYSQKDVRISLYHGLWTDSLKLRRIGPQWRQFDQRLQKLLVRDSAELEVVGIPTVRRRKQKSLHTLIPHYLSTSYQKVPDRLHPAMVTSSLVDSRGWKWVGTLRGLCIDIGSAIVPVETRPYCDSRRPVRALSGDDTHLKILRYDGSTDTITWTSLIGKGRLSSIVPLPSVTFSWIPWMGNAPTAVVSVQDTSQVIYFFGNRYGVGSLHSIPTNLITPKSASEAPWQGTVNCGLVLNKDTILLGTDRGMWYLTPSTHRISQVRLSPEYLNNADIRSMGKLLNGLLRITIPYFDAVVFDTIRIDENTPMIARREAEPYIFEKTLAVANPIVAYLHGINASHIGDPRNRPAPIYSVPLPGLRVWMWDRTMFLHDAVESTFTLHSIPDSLPVDSAFSIASFGASNNVIGVANSDGLLVASITRNHKGPAQRLIAYRTPSMTHFTVAAEGAELELSGAERDFELITGRPSSWGAISIRQSFYLPWSAQLVSSRTNRVDFVNNVPVGEHDLFIRSDDRYDPLHVHITAVPVLTETAWFRAGVVVLFLGLLTGSFRYVILARRSRRDARERIHNTERLQIGQDVHDAVGADLVRISIAARSEPTRENNKEIARLTREASRTLRDIIWSVSESHTLDAVIAVTIERVRAMSDESGLAVAVYLPSDISSRTLAPQTSRDIVLIISEAMTNIIKHARAQNVRYDINGNADQLTLVLSDDGRGFDVDRSFVGVGIRSMRSRAQRSGLVIDMTSYPDNGTRVSVTIPFGLK